MNESKILLKGEFPETDFMEAYFIQVKFPSVYNVLGNELALFSFKSKGFHNYSKNLHQQYGHLTGL